MEEQEQYEIQVRCRDCYGQGNLECPNCGGLGTSNFTNDGYCPMCYGARHMPCPTCYGDGWILAVVNYNPDNPEYQQMRKIGKKLVDKVLDNGNSLDS